MKPLLFELAGLRFHSYNTAMALAFLVCALLAAREGRLLKKPVYIPVQGAVWTLLGGLVGAKVFWILQYSEPKYLLHSFAIWEAGLVLYGGLIGGITGTVIYIRVTKTFDWRIADVVVPYVALAQAITRIGCFLNGCCFGKVCQVPWGVRFRNTGVLNAHESHVEAGLIPSDAEFSLFVHPTQLYMTFGLVVTCLLLRVGLRRKPFTFAVALEYIFLYGVVRFIVEHFRGDSVESVFGMTVSQTISLALVIGSATAFAIVMYVLSKRGLLAQGDDDDAADQDDQGDDHDELDEDDQADEGGNADQDDRVDQDDRGDEDDGGDEAPDRPDEA